MDFEKCSKSAKKDCNCCPLFSSLCFSSLRCSFLAYFERLWQRAMELPSLVLHEFELPKALPWNIYSSPSFLNCFGDQKAIKTPKLNTIWLELIARVLNMLIELKGNNYYLKVFKRVNYKLSNSTFWVVINRVMPIVMEWHRQLQREMRELVASLFRMKEKYSGCSVEVFSIEQMKVASKFN